ncbi:lysozyme inhibitor LprI family protein [Candidatus Halobeggiatoa sp. HSG11]|nr:lysozyme inhibitor LprI family protein [Candidatus Halobeggiatoa sp. HSG11]
MSSSVFGASFNCNKATTKLEHLICENNELSDLDSQLGTLYSKLRKSLSADEKRKLKKEQILWIKQRNRCGLSNDCLIYSYEDRILELEELNGNDSNLVQKSNCKNVILKEYESTIFGDVAGGSNCYELSINSEQKQKKLIDIKLNSMCDNAVFSLIGVADASDADDHYKGKIGTGKYKLSVFQLFCKDGCAEKERYEINITLLDDKSIFEKFFEKSESLVTEITFLPEKLQEVNATNMIRLSPSFFKGAKFATDSYRRELAVKFQIISKSVNDVKTMEDLTNKIDFRGINYNDLFPSYKEILMLTNFQFWDGFSKELYSQTEKDSLDLLNDIDSRFDMFYTKEEGTEEKRYVFKAGYISIMIALSYASKSILDNAMLVANKIVKKNNSIKKVSKWIDSNKIIATAYFYFVT